MRMKTTTWIGLVPLLAFFVAGCGDAGSQESGPAAGSPEWYWQAAEENLESGDFGKAIEHLDAVAAEDGPLKTKAVLYRTVLLTGLSRGDLALADAYRAGIDTVGARSDAWQNPMQQALRDGRRFSIELAESLGAVDKAMNSDPVVLDFPMPRGGSQESVLLTSLQSGDEMAASQLTMASDQTLRREMVMAIVELMGKADDAEAAKTAFETGGAKIPQAEARLAMAKMLLDVSVLYDRLRVNDPDIRKILLERSEKWIQPYLEAEDEKLKATAARLQEEIADERLDMEGKRRKLGVRG